MMMDFDLLHHVYHFPGLDIPDTQDKTVCAKLMDLFIEFAKKMVRFISEEI